MSFAKRLISKWGVFSALLAGLGVAMTPSEASAACATWGCGTARVYNGNVIFGDSDDIRTDGYCVYQRIRTAAAVYRNWPGAEIPTSKSCGRKASYFLTIGTYTLGVRLYREDGRYMTLWGY